MIDHHGLTEVGPISFECWEGPGFVHLNECEFLCEVIDPSTGQPVDDGEEGELVVTTLGRIGPARWSATARGISSSGNGVPVSAAGRWPGCGAGSWAGSTTWSACAGVNVYPSAIEAVVRDLNDVVEYRATVTVSDSLTTLSLEIETPPSLASERLGGGGRANAPALRAALGLTVPVTRVAAGTLPRFDLKAKRFHVER